MGDIPKLTPAGAPVMDCEHDHECTVLTCDFCLKELPENNGIREEGQDYIAHFCGLECFEAWQQRHAHEKRLDKDI
jgi:hypothetical protein